MAGKKIGPLGGNEPVIIDDAGDRSDKGDKSRPVPINFRAKKQKKNLKLGKPETIPFSSFSDIDIVAIDANKNVLLEVKKKAAATISISSGAAVSPLTCSAGIFGVITPGGPMTETSNFVYTLPNGGPIVTIQVDDTTVDRPNGTDHMAIAFTIQ